MKKQKKRWGKRLSLKGALVATTLACVIAGILTCGMEMALLSEASNTIYRWYVHPYLPENGEACTYRENGVYIHLETELPQYYHDPETGTMYPMETTSPGDLISNPFLRFFWKYSGLIQLFALFVTAGLFFALDAAWFYRWKLKRPLAVLNSAAEKIGQNDLDFKIKQESSDELGRLCGSFETMRASLEENHRSMWRAMEERRRLNAAFAHDLRTPLTVLQGYSDYLLEGLPSGKISSEKAADTAATMRRSVSRLQSYVEGMSSLQRLEDLVPDRRETEFSALCGQMKDTAEILCGEKGCAFSAEGGGALFMDPEVVLQVFENLLSNGSRYARQAVEILVRAENGRLTLAVGDDGPGFPPEGLQRATEPYYRAEKGEQEGCHFGLGLTICRMLCEKHGGGLALENRQSGGARVTAEFDCTAPE